MFSSDVSVVTELLDGGAGVNIQDKVRLTVMVDTRGVGEAMMLMSTLRHAHDKFSQAFPIFVLQAMMLMSTLRHAHDKFSQAFPIFVLQAMMLMSTLRHAHDKFSQAFPIFVLQAMISWEKCVTSTIHAYYIVLSLHTLV